MLETPLEITDEVKGLEPLKGGCRFCSTIEWFMENQFPIPEEIEIFRPHREEGFDEEGIEEDGIEESQTIH
jgi:hypothetical protein